MGVDYVFLDEVSMLSARDLYKISSQLCKVLNVLDMPFGNMNMVFSGDFSQLPPAMGGENVSLYSRVIGAIASNVKSQEEATSAKPESSDIDRSTIQSYTNLGLHGRAG